MGPRTVALAVRRPQLRVCVQVRVDAASRAMMARRLWLPCDACGLALLRRSQQLIIPVVHT